MTDEDVQAVARPHRPVFTAEYKRRTLKEAGACTTLGAAGAVPHWKSQLKTLLLSVLPVRAAVRLMMHRPYGAFRISGDLSTAFHLLYYTDENRTWLNTHWLGVPVRKLPLDLWIYQEIIYETKPDVIVEAGTLHGGSAYFFASVFDILGRGRVLTVDLVDDPGKPSHERITYLLGSSTSDETFQRIRGLIRDSERVMVTLDSDHHKSHVLKELRLYSSLVTPGNYLVVEDTNLNGHPVLPNFGPGPWEAVEEFLKGNPDFVADRDREKFFLTFFPRGYVKRVR